MEPRRRAFRNPSQALAAVAVAVFLVASGYAARRLAEVGWTAVVSYPTPFAIPLPSAPAGPPLVRRAVVVVVDGLRDDASRRMPALNALRSRGAGFVAWTGEPSLSLPGWTAILTGAPQAVSGVTTNWYRGPVRVDSLFASARRSGVRTAVAGTPGWSQLFGPWVDEVREVPDPDYGDTEGLYRSDGAVASAALGLLATSARLVVVHFPGPDVAGHSFGAASPVYAEAVRRVDEHLGALARALGPGDVLIVTADHGHTDRGGHGGWEPEVRKVPLVLAGQGIRPGTTGPEVSQVDIAPTVAALLGIPVPAHSAGRPLVEALDGDLRPAVRGWAAQQKALADLYARRLGAGPGPAADAQPDPQDVPAVQRALWAHAQDVARGRLAAERARRLPLVAGTLLVGGLYALWAFRRRTLAAAAAGAAVYFLVVLGLFFGRGFRWSLSVFNTEGQILAFFAARTVDAVVGLAAAAVTAGICSRGPAGRAARAGLDAAALTAAALAAQVAYFVWLWGVRFPWYLPDLRLGFKYYLDLLQLVPVGLLGPAAPLPALAGYGAVRLARRRAGAPRPGGPPP